MEYGRRTTRWNEIELIEQVHKIIKAYNQIRYPNDTSKHVLLEAAYPDYVFEPTGAGGYVDKTHVICYDIVKKEDGSVGPNRFDKNKVVRPKVFTTENIQVGTDSAGDPILKTQDVLVKHYDLLYRFDCMTASDRESMNLVRDFERMMEIHAQFLETGCKRFIYNGRRPSYFNRDTRYKSRTCEFFAQVEEHWYSVGDRIDEINISYLNIESVGHIPGNADAADDS